MPVFQYCRSVCQSNFLYQWTSYSIRGDCRYLLITSLLFFLSFHTAEDSLELPIFLPHLLCAEVTGLLWPQAYTTWFTRCCAPNLGLCACQASILPPDPRMFPWCLSLLPLAEKLKDFLMMENWVCTSKDGSTQCVCQSSDHQCFDLTFGFIALKQYENERLFLSTDP